MCTTTSNNDIAIPFNCAREIFFVRIMSTCFCCGDGRNTSSMLDATLGSTVAVVFAAIVDESTIQSMLG